jgi:thiamine kinase-like enzyme
VSDTTRRADGATPQPAPISPRVAAALRALLGADARDARLSVLEGGLSNTTYRVVVDSEQYVLKLRRDGPGATLSLAEELALLEAVAPAGVTAAPIGADAPTGALLTRFVPNAHPWTPSVARRPRNIERLAPLLHTLHDVAFRTRPFTATRFAADYVAAAARRRTLDARALRLGAELATLASEFEARYPPTALCHGDLVAANVLDDGALRLVDFEYASCAAPILDLAILAAMNEFDAGQSAALCAIYFAGRVAPTSEEFATVVRMARLMSYFWELATLANASMTRSIHLPPDARSAE